MRVLIDTTYARRAPLSGTGIYIERLCEAIAQTGDVDVIDVANTRRRPPAGGGLGSVRNVSRDLWWAAVELPRLARRAGAELIHHPLPASAPRTGLPQVVTVLDLAFERLPDGFDRGFRLYAQRSHRAAAAAASAVICISETTARDACELWGIPRSRIVVAPLGPGQELHAPSAGHAARRMAEREAPGYFLYVGDAEPRKNLGMLLEAYATYQRRADEPLALVLAGTAAGDGEGVRVVTRPSAAELAELYRGAAALVHPSLYEGFGMTAVEAMSLGTPVLAASSPGVVETCADAVLYADPHDPGTFAEAMARIAVDGSARATLADRGRRRARVFSWAACARAHVEAYSLALGA